MDKVFCEKIIEQVLVSIENGGKRFLFWGVNLDTVYLFSELKNLGLLQSFVIGLVDSNPEKHGLNINDVNVSCPNDVKKMDFDTLVVASDIDKETILYDFLQSDNRIPKVILAGNKHLQFQDEVFQSLKNSCLVKSYANGYVNTLIHIYQTIEYLSKNGIKGDVVEFGIFKGGTTVFIAKVLKHFGFDDIKMYGFDIFDGFPQSKHFFDLYSNPDCEFKDFDSVDKYCKSFDVEVIKGDICDTHRFLEDKQLMFTFFDTDNYSPSRKALETCYRQTVKGGIFAFDHYTTEERFIYTIGERLAAKEFFADKNVFHLHDTGIFVKV
jgi:hypothetical protein